MYIIHLQNVMSISILYNKSLKLGCSFFNCFMKWNWRPLSLKSWHFEASEDIMTKFKSQGLHTIRIKYWNGSGSGSPHSLIPALCNIGILLHKQATQTKHICPECTVFPHIVATATFLFWKMECGKYSREETIVFWIWKLQPIQIVATIFQFFT